MDKRAIRILFETYWSPSGWHQDPRLPKADDFEYAKAHGVMFDPISPTHDELISQLRATAAKLEPRQVADGFLASLSTRRLDWRSALGSYSVARWLQDHDSNFSALMRQCPTCGLYDHGRGQARDRNVLNFERLKWGGVRHSDPLYAALDLGLFLSNPPPLPTATDRAIFRDLVDALSSAPAGVTSAQLHKHLPASLKANKAERDQLVAVLGLCGILATAAHPGFFDRFVPAHQRTLPDRHYVDMAYPACWWTGSDGVNSGRLQELFGHAL